MITYQEIYDLLRKEKYNEALQDIPKKFLKELSNYLSEKKALVEKNKEGGLFDDTIKITRKQLENAQAVIKELISLREKKVLNLSFTAAQTGVSKRDTENLLDHEKELFEITIKQLEENEKNVLNILEEGQVKEEKDLKNLFIRFKQETPSFLDSSGIELGPFKEGEVANLPKEIANILITDGRATIVKTD